MSAARAYTSSLFTKGRAVAPAGNVLPPANTGFRLEVCCHGLQKRMPCFVSSQLRAALGNDWVISLLSVFQAIATSFAISPAFAEVPAAKDRLDVSAPTTIRFPRIRHFETPI
jgi:hypothetical protein